MILNATRQTGVQEPLKYFIFKSILKNKPPFIQKDGSPQYIEKGSSRRALFSLFLCGYN